MHCRKSRIYPRRVIFAYNQKAHPAKGEPFPMLLRIRWEPHGTELAAKYAADGQSLLRCLLAAVRNNMNNQHPCVCLNFRDKKHKSVRLLLGKTSLRDQHRVTVRLSNDIAERISNAPSSSLLVSDTGFVRSSHPIRIGPVSERIQRTFWLLTGVHTARLA